MTDGQVTVIRSDRRTLSMEITREGTVVVHAPRRLPQEEIDRFLAAHRQWMKTHLEAAARRAAAHPEPTPAEETALRARARAVLPGRVAYFAAQMGVVPAGITVTGARTRFGSCSGKNRLSFSFRLMQYSDAAVDYVVVHELAHIRHHDHSRRFYDFVASVLPDWQARQRELRGR